MGILPFVILLAVSFFLTFVGGLVYSALKGPSKTFVGFSVGGIVVFLGFYLSSKLNCFYGLSFLAVAIGVFLGLGVFKFYI